MAHVWTSPGDLTSLPRMPVLPRLKTYDEVYAQFRWQVPARYNIGVDICDRWAAREPGRTRIKDR